jgi:hypothetical protein
LQLPVQLADSRRFKSCQCGIRHRHVAAGRYRLLQQTV